ncbi:hypothetical protein JXB02_05870 [Candidatus Woesearchaeota archaeon]|nr:hypothetical protein [Candidatus Woesearchaeota archaeon]
MLRQLRDAAKAKEYFEAVQKDLASQQERIGAVSGTVERLAAAVAALTEGMASLQEAASRLEERSAKATARMEALTEKLRNELNDFRLVKRKLDETVARRLKEEFEATIGTLQADVKSYNGLKAGLSGVSSELTSLKAEMSKFMAISINLKAGDFELARYAKRLEQDDAEKLRLMRRIDGLERMVARQRRTR